MSLLNTKMKAELQAGAYIATVKNFREVEATKPYVEIVYTVENTEIIDRLFAGRIAYVMMCLRKQFGMEFEDVTLQQLLETKHDIAIEISYSGEYGQQINYINERF